MRQLLVTLAVITITTTPVVAATESDLVEKSFPSADIKRLSVSNLSGQIEITGTEAPQASVKIAKKAFGEHCDLSIENAGGALEVRVEKKGMSIRDCKADITVTVPKAADLSLSAGSGALHVKSTRGKVDFQVGSGNVEVDGEDIATVDGRTGSGDVAVSGLVGGGKIKTGSGTVKIRYAKAPARGSLDIRTGSGNAEVGLPADAKLRSSLATGSGSLKNDLGDTSDATFVVQMKSGSGSLRIRRN